ncbi:MAG: mercury methylation corrinoid protein HgcA [Desulfocapsaceae bacterium]
MYKEDTEQVCCGGPPPPKSSPYARPGYTLCRYVEEVRSTGAGPVPVVSTSRSFFDWAGGAAARLGLNRDHYLVAPGLYAVGKPDGAAPILVTANYKLSFDALRFALPGINVWLLVLDTCGINVWCAAGKGTFSTEELVYRVKACGLEKLVDHRRLVVPQLGATGVSAHQVKKQSGFSVKFGPIRASDITTWLDNGAREFEGMRDVTFTLKERIELIPVEFHLVLKSMWWLFPLLFLLSGIGPDLEVTSRLMSRGMWMVFALLTGIGSGLILVPLLLPWLPGRSFALKGAVAGLIVGPLLLFWFETGLSLPESGALLALVVVMSSYLGMNFTGSTPYTSPSGVEWEMRRAIPVQFCLSVGALLLWVGAPLVLA